MDRECFDYRKLGIHLNQFMGSSSSIGAKRVRNVCLAFRAASEQNNRAAFVQQRERVVNYIDFCLPKKKVRRLVR